jgi:hypothetical protein
VPTRLPWLPLLLCGCAAAPEPTAFERGVEVEPFGAAEFPGAEALLGGFGPSRDVPDWLPDEQVLYGVRLDREGRAQRWLVRLTVLRATVPQSSLAPLIPGGSRLRYVTDQDEELQFESAWIEIGVEVFDAHGNLLRSSPTQAAGDLLRRGFVEACTTARELLARAPERAVLSHRKEGRAVAAGVVALLSFLELARADPSLSPILWEAVERPSALAVLADFGVKLGLHVRFEQAEPVQALAGRPGWRVPATLLVNDGERLHCRLSVVEPVPPLRLGAGLVALEAVRPRDDSVRLRLELLGARLPEPRRAK